MKRSETSFCHRLRISYHHASIARKSCCPQLDSSVLCAKVAKEPPKSVSRLSVEVPPSALDVVSCPMGLGRHIVAVILSSVATVFQIKSVEMPVQHCGRRKLIFPTKSIISWQPHVQRSTCFLGTETIRTGFMNVHDIQCPSLGLVWNGLAAWLLPKLK